MVQSVEILVDDALDAAVRAEWAALSAAGLPGQADHTGASNAPHVTLLAVPALPPSAEEVLSGLDVPVGAPVRLGGHLVLGGGRRLVLARSVVPDVALLALQDRIRAAVGVDVPPTFESGGWTPHVTLSTRLDLTTIGAALAALADAPRELTGTIGGVRRWDGDARRTWVLPRPAGS